MPVLPTNNISPVCQYIIEIWPIIIACTWENCVLLATFWDKYWYYIWAKWSTALRAVMVHSVRRIALLLASLCVALPSHGELKKPSWIDWTIEISPLHSLSFAQLVPTAQDKFFFLPTSRKVFPLFQTVCPVGIQIAQTAVHFAHFQVQASKNGVLGWAWALRVLCVRTFPWKGCVMAE